MLQELIRLQSAVRVNDGRTWDEQGARDCVDDICDVFRTLKLEEIQYVIRRIRRGEIELYARLDTPTLMKALRDHDVNLTTAFRQSEQTSRSMDIAPDSQLAEVLREVADGLPREHLTLEQALARGSVLTNEEKDQMRKRDAERNENRT